MRGPPTWLLAAWIAVPQAAIGGPWARPAGEVYGKLGVGRFTGTAAFDSAGPVALSGEEAPTFVGDAVEGYGEVGLGGGLELDGSARWVVHRVGGEVTRGLQDLELVTEWAPVSSREAFALTAGLRVSPYPRGLRPEIGPGGTDLLLGGGWGRSLGPAWTAVDVALRQRLTSPSAGLRVRGEVGVLGSAPLGAAANVELQPAFGRTGRAGPTDSAPVPRVLAFGLKGFVRLPAGFGLAADVAALPKLINDGPGMRLGVGVTWEGAGRGP
jgi:hypothetical protein